MNIQHQAPGVAPLAGVWDIGSEECATMPYQPPAGNPDIHSRTTGELLQELCRLRAEAAKQRAQFDAQLQKQREFRATFRRHYREKKAAIDQLHARLRQSDSENEQLRQEVEDLRRVASRRREPGSSPAAVASPPPVPGPPSAAAHAPQAAGSAELQTTRSTGLRALQAVYQQATGAGNANSLSEDHDVRRPLAASGTPTRIQRRGDGQSSLRAVVPSTALPAIDSLRLAHNEDFHVLPASLPSPQDRQAQAAAQPMPHGNASSALGRHRTAARGSLVSVSNRGSRVAAGEGGRPVPGPIRRHAEQPGAAEAQSSKGWKRKRGGGDNFMPDALPAALRTSAAGPPPVNINSAGDQPMASPHLAAVSSIPETPRASPDAGNQEDSEDGQPRYKYQERVRKKADRELLVGRDCQDCAGWYAALKTLGIGGMADTRPACGHAAGGAGRDAIDQLRQDASRHRARHAPPPTPAGFWDLGFHDTAEQAAKRLPPSQLLHPREPRKLTR